MRLMVFWRESSLDVLSGSLMIRAAPAPSPWTHSSRSPIRSGFVLLTVHIPCTVLNFNPPILFKCEGLSSTFCPHVKDCKPATEASRHTFVLDISHAPRSPGRWRARSRGLAWGQLSWHGSCNFIRCVESCSERGGSCRERGDRGSAGVLLLPPPDPRPPGQAP